MHLTDSTRYLGAGTEDGDASGSESFFVSSLEGSIWGSFVGLTTLLVTVPVAPTWTILFLFEVFALEYII